MAERLETLISSLYVDGSMVEDIGQIEKDLIAHSKTLYSKKSLQVAWSEKWEGKIISEQSVTWVERPFTIEEIKSTVFALSTNKAPGSDGFAMAFTKNVGIQLQMTFSLSSWNSICTERSRKASTLLFWPYSKKT